ncbi:MAG: pyridoxal-phosphate dependent enzyme [Mariprofundus sp.]|nr:pyridoxal-phosphate dependent enzyme [Mariprofundus sp.]
MLSSVEKILVRGRNYYLKRDDLIDPLLSGNKYRKLYALIQAPAEQYERIISYGGTQSNAMLSIAALCQQKGWRFDYTSKTVAAHLKKRPTGNLKVALELGMQLHEVEPVQYAEAIEALKATQGSSTLLLNQGGADPLARAGIEQLAHEIRVWQADQSIESPLHVVTPSGTGTTAYYLACALPDVWVWTTAVVGDSAYLLSQMGALGPLVANLKLLESPKKYHFAQPYAEFLAMYRELLEAGLEVDLIYGAQMWQALLEHRALLDGAVLYLHSGGLIGNETMLDRYVHKGLF